MFIKFGNKLVNILLHSSRKKNEKTKENHEHVSAHRLVLWIADNELKTLRVLVTIL